MIVVSGKPYTKDRHGQDLGDVTGQRFVREYLAGCTIGRCRGAEFINCHLKGAKFVGDNLRDFLTVTATLNCENWENITLPERTFEGLLKLFSITNCGEQKRAGLRALIDPGWLYVLDRTFPNLE